MKTSKRRRERFCGVRRGGVGCGMWDANGHRRVVRPCQVLGVVIVRGLEVDAVVLGGHPDGFFPPAHRLIQLVEQVEALAVGVQVLGLVGETLAAVSRARNSFVRSVSVGR